MAIRQRTQSDLIGELERRRPKLVVYASSTFGLPSWDGIGNPVRHYDVSQYLLDHYRPLLLSHGYLLMARNGSPPALARVDRWPRRAAVTGAVFFLTHPPAIGATPRTS